jgi:hypothetical protein
VAALRPPPLKTLPGLRSEKVLPVLGMPAPRVLLLSSAPVVAAASGWLAAAAPVAAAAAGVLANGAGRVQICGPPGSIMAVPEGQAGAIGKVEEAVMGAMSVAAVAEAAGGGVVGVTG